MSSSRDDFGIAIRSALLQKGTRQKFSLFFLLCLSIGIFFLDANKFSFINTGKALINDLIYRVSNVATSPIRFTSYLGQSTKKHFFIYSENAELKEEIKKLKAKELDYEFLKSQNSDFKNILESNDQKITSFPLAKVLVDKDSPFLKSIIINKGKKSEIQNGMPVLDGQYLVGRIVETNYLSSRVLLLTDLNSRIPVVLGENYDQAILSGKGKNLPELEYLPENYLLKDNVNVFTSGKGGIFVPGIPIGRTQIDDEKIKVKLFSDPNQLSFVGVQLTNTTDEVKN